MLCRVIFFSVMGADLSKVFTIAINAPSFADLTFSSSTLEDVVRDNKPGLIIFDSIQSFFDYGIHLSERNDVRRCVQTLIGYGSDYGTTTILVVHSNKRLGAFGRVHAGELKRGALDNGISDATYRRAIQELKSEDVIKYVSESRGQSKGCNQYIMFAIADTPKK